MSKIIAIANHKGGVGKSTSVASIGSYLAAKGKRTLVVDLDAQSNLTSSLIKGETEGATIYEALKGAAPLPTIKVAENLFLVPSSLDLAGVELELASAMAREYILKELIGREATRYDYILIDCPPSLGLLTINALVAADYLIVPLTAEALPFKGLRMLEDVLAMVRGRLNPSISLSGILITRYNSRKLNRMVEEELRERYGSVVFNSKVRENISLAEAPLSSTPISDYAPESNGAKDYEAVTDEIVSRWG